MGGDMAAAAAAVYGPRMKGAWGAMAGLVGQAARAKITEEAAEVEVTVAPVAWEDGEAAKMVKTVPIRMEVMGETMRMVILGMVWGDRASGEAGEVEEVLFMIFIAILVLAGVAGAGVAAKRLPEAYWRVVMGAMERGRREA
jgi:hypothetical protein